MIYLDANIFAYSFLSEDEKAHLCRKILAKVADKEIAAFTSALTWDEITWAARKNLGLEDAKEEGRKFAEFPFLNILDANSIIIGIAQQLVERYGIKPRDAIHAATAIANGIRELVSDDPDFDAIKEIKRVPIEKFR
ncbi:MAG: type II toxin-antitoxin system VapC family toxin [Candidatus Aenigmarchaeota archaeon]|nr:type II toxin-antitoxin system VapC family toxin [Candidatus Aenigmarchaeota archaeon]